MGVSLRYCDLCGTKMSAEQLEDPSTLKVQNKIFCGECRPKVIAKIQAQRAKAQEAAGGAAPAAAAGKKAAAPAGRAAAPKAGARRAAGGAAKRAAAPKRGAAPKGKAAPKRGAAPAAKPAGRTAAAGRKPARAARPARSRDEAIPVGGEDEDEGPKSFAVKKRSNAPVIIIVSLMFVVTLGVVGYAVTRPEKEKPKETTKVVEEPKVNKREELSKEAIADAKKFRAENPTKYAYQYQKFVLVERNFKGYAAHEEAKKLVGEVQDEWRQAADDAVDTITTKANSYLEKLQFDEAYKVAHKQNDAIDTYYANFNWDRYSLLRDIREDTKRQVAAYERLLELMRKAITYAKKSPPEDDIASAILEEFDSRYEELKVWEIYERNMAEINKASIAGFEALDKEMSALIAKRDAERKAKEAAARQKAWDETRGKVAWWPHIGRHNLRNWLARQGDWKLETRDGTNVMIGRNPGSASTIAGIFGSHWQDFVLRFEINMKKGQISISPRSVVASRSLQNTSEYIDLKAEEVGKNQWVTLEVEVQGDEVRIYKNRTGSGGTPWKTFTGGYDGDYRLLDIGGPAFSLSDDTHVEIRNVETKLVSHNRPVY